MIFVDTNIFLGYIVEPKTPQDMEMQRRARALFAGISDGSVAVTTDGVVLHEVCWVLGAKTRYGVSVDKIVAYMRAILSLPGWSFTAGDGKAYFRALEIFAQNPKLEFADSLIAARAEAMNATLATFDRRLAKAYSGDVWE